jgi:anti-sigma factor RsiW
MTPCDADILSRYLDGGISPDERDALDRHLASCRACAHELAELRRVDMVISAWGSQQRPVPLQTQQRIRRSVERRNRLPAVLAWSRMLPAALGTSVAAVLVMLSANLGLLLQSQAPGVASSPSTISKQLKKQSRPLTDSRRISAILSGHDVSALHQSSTRRGQLPEIY